MRVALSRIYLHERCRMKIRTLLLSLATVTLGLGACTSTEQNLAQQKFIEPAPTVGSNLRRVYTADNPPPPSQARQGDLSNMRSGGNFTGGTSSGLPNN